MKDPHSTRVLQDIPDSEAAPIGPYEGDDWFYGDTHTGQVRTNNEDRFLCDEARGLFIVADGMGGHAAGEEASRIVLATLSNVLTPDVLSAPSPHKALADVLQTANNEVIRQSESNFQWRGMGSTVVVASLQDDTLYTANVGDSRAYVLREGRLHQISRDHSVAAGLAEQNQIKREEIRTHVLRNRLTMCLGIEEQIMPDTLRLDLQHGDCVLLCSDGLWDMLADEEITHLLQLYQAPPEAVKALIQAANEAGGKDNITAIVFRPQLSSPSADTGDDTVILRTNVNA
ncbi:Stp1/IreP family PP2C-type Ser/Thr phosphatase [bacterium]|nr:MAG: Stp1/IreP family PP2C-type Ser/Thr phosphatase [bacterium]